MWFYFRVILEKGIFFHWTSENKTYGIRCQLKTAKFTTIAYLCTFHVVVIVFADGDPVLKLSTSGTNNIDVAKTF
jgi:hypothetical protein